MSEQCEAKVWYWGELRSCGIKKRFERQREWHYCKRKAKVGKYCKQHAYLNSK